ncbi:MAG TPA: CHAP domain-containing protein [Pseudolysinimonas sp.]|nr:CHAP domain-containing protein [Pseudolysinimonas sp.]
MTERVDREPSSISPAAHPLRDRADSGFDSIVASAPVHPTRRSLRESGSIPTVGGSRRPGGRGTSKPAARLSPRTRRSSANPDSPLFDPSSRAAGRAAARRAVRASKAPRNWRQRLSATGVMVVVVGFFASLTLPAYAEGNAPVAAAAAAAGAAQTLVAGANVETDAAGRGDYGVTSAETIRAVRSSALRDANLAAYLRSGAKALGDDYPWPAELSNNQGGGLSPLRYYYRECVDFVAWRLNRDAGSFSAPFKWDWSTLTPGSGNASAWKTAWVNHGWATGTTPEVGAVAWFAGQNHVAYVSAITADGGVLLEEYNQQGDHNYHQRIIAPGEAYYLYAPPA